jgi:serine/threonine protein kinase
MKNYDFSIDIWSLGCTLAELYIGSPLFPGKSEIEILGLISNSLGSINVPIIFTILVTNLPRI